MTNNTLDELNEEFNSAVMHDSFEEDFNTDDNQIMMAFTDYDKVKHVDIKNDKMFFWKNHKDEHKLIYPLACIVHSIPASQALIESHFSSFSYVRSNKRCSLKAENVQNILTVRLNKELFYDQKKHDLATIIKDSAE